MTIAAPEARVVLHRVSWDTYERLLADHADSPGTRFAYDEGNLEIMVAQIGHERLKSALSRIADAAAFVLELDYSWAGSTTFRREDLQKGFEPDASYYFDQPEHMREKTKIDLREDPPPDLVIEIDITTDSLNKFPIFAGIGVPEVWVYSEGEVRMFELRAGAYRAIKISRFLAPLTPGAVTQFLAESRLEKSWRWLERVQAWVKSHSATAE